LGLFVCRYGIAAVRRIKVKAQLRWFFLSVLFLGALAMNQVWGEELPLYEMDPVVVTATRYPEKLSNIANKTIVLERRRLAQANFLTLGEALLKESNLNLNYGGAYGQNTTLSLRGSTSSQVLFLLNGRPLNPITTGNFNLAELPLSIVERVEVVEGTLSNLYGANALGGVVNLITQTGPEEGVLTGRVGYGSFNTYHGSLKLHKQSKSFGLDLNLERLGSDNDRPNSNFRLTSGALELSYYPGDSSRLSLLLRGQGDRLGVPGAVPDPQAVPVTGSEEVYSLRDFQEDRLYSVDLTLQSSLKAEDDLEVRLFHENRRLDYHTEYFYWNLSLEDYRYTVKTNGGLAEYSPLSGSWGRLNLGVDYRHDELEADQFYQTLPDSSVSWNPSAQSVGGWANGTLHLGEKWTLSPGLRYDYQEDYQGNLSPNMGIIYHLNSKTHFKASYGYSFRAPGFNDLYWPDFGFTAGNLKLDPETGHGGEVGLRTCPTDKVETEVSLWRRQVEDLISWAPLGPGGRFQPFNIDEYLGWGVDLRVAVRVGERVRLKANYSYNHSRETKNDLVYADYFSGVFRFEEVERKARFVPEHLAGLNIVWDPLESTNLNLSLTWKDEVVNYYAVYDPVTFVDIYYLPKKLSSFEVIDLAINQKVVKSLTLFFKVENLTDNRTAEQFGNYLDDKNYPKLGRRFEAGMEFELDR
jgi:outer membrane cobalamin receptor